MRRIAFFGGSFDPPHRGHLTIAKEAANHFSLDQVLFAPVGHQPLKGARSATPFLHRYAMTALATQGDARFVPSLLDAPHGAMQENRPNYTVETLTRLRASLDDNESATLFTLLGADSWSEIALWHQAPQLLALSDWIVAARPGFSLANAENALPPDVTVVRVENSSEPHLLLPHAAGGSTRVWFLPFMQEDISATELRAALDLGLADVKFLIPAVREYVRKAGLYQPCS